MKQIPVVFSTDHNFVVPACVAISTLLRGDSEHAYLIHLLLDADVTDDDKAMMTRVVEQTSAASAISFIVVENEFMEAHVERNITRAAYYRLLIPWLLPQYDRVIYSDVDILFCGGGVGALYEQFDMEGLYVAGANRQSYRQKCPFNQHILDLNLDPDKYINDGFILINARLQRQDNLLERYKEAASKNMNFMDQDVINVVCRGKIGYFSEAYNASPQSTIQGAPCHVLHFVGVKPWNIFCLGWSEWWNAYKESAVFDKKYYEQTLDRQYHKMKQFLVYETLSKRPFIAKCIEWGKKYPWLDKVVSRMQKLKNKLLRR